MYETEFFQALRISLHTGNQCLKVISHPMQCIALWCWVAQRSTIRHHIAMQSIWQSIQCE